MTHLLRVSRRILNKPQLISENGALAVLGALASRLGIARVLDVSGVPLEIEAPAPAPVDKAVGSVVAPKRDWDDGRVFAFEPSSGIAYIPIEGELVHRFGHLEPYSGMTGYDSIKLKVQAAAEDSQVKGILYDYDTPGGEVFGADGTAEAIFKAREAKPSWALVNEMALSAGYWLASAAHAVFAPATADSGSIGVVMLHADISRQLDKEGITVTLIHSGTHKVDGHPFAPLPDSVEADFQAETDAIRALFASKVARNRGLSEAAVLDTEARVLPSSDAVAAGLVDAIASEDDVFEEFAARLARQQPTALLPRAQP